MAEKTFGGLLVISLKTAGKRTGAFHYPLKRPELGLKKIQSSPFLALMCFSTNHPDFFPSPPSSHERWSK